MAITVGVPIADHTLCCQAAIAIGVGIKHGLDISLIEIAFRGAIILRHNAFCIPENAGIDFVCGQTAVSAGVPAFERGQIIGQRCCIVAVQ